jgi:uncharacterized protein YjbJ (UPF0337 family)
MNGNSSPVYVHFRWLADDTTGRESWPPEPFEARAAADCENLERKKEKTMNKDQMQGKWEQVKGKARERWGKLTDNDLQQIQGRSEQLSGAIQERYGVTKEEAEKQIDSFCRSC